ncbi:MAG: YiiX/YebB-like N1pC/P60 family cysteine hydrolase [Paludibacter sp.]|nr:YiiX/YebB-like N1pC/P60 family cysteine hydrolase [Paludibacter sp.]
MKLRKQSKVIGFCLVLFILFYFVNKKEEVLVNEIDKNKIEDFDIIMSKGQSVQSKLIGLLKFSIEDYSHIGIMIKENDKVFVLHSTPDGTNANGIRYDDLQTFFDLSDVSDYTVLRYQNISSDFRQRLRMEFERFKNSQAPFDFDFNNFDHRKIYCSELVCIIFKNPVLSALQEFDMTKPIYPKYFLKMEGFITINSKKTSP